MVENTSIKFDYIFSINKAQYTSLLIQILLEQNKILEKKKKKKKNNHYLLITTQALLFEQVSNLFKCSLQHLIGRRHLHIRHFLLI